MSRGGLCFDMLVVSSLQRQGTLMMHASHGGHCPWCVHDLSARVRFSIFDSIGFLCDCLIVGSQDWWRNTRPAPIVTCLDGDGTDFDAESLAMACNDEVFPGEDRCITTGTGATVSMIVFHDKLLPGLVSWCWCKRSGVGHIVCHKLSGIMC